MLDSKSLTTAMNTLNGVTATMKVGGMAALHDSLNGRIELLFSPTQMLDNRVHIPDYNVNNHRLSKFAGADVVLDADTGNVHTFTDIKVLEGEEDSINYRCRPFSMSKIFNTKGVDDNSTAYADMKYLGTANPQKLISLVNCYGSITCIAFEDPNPRNGSLVNDYGREDALEIVKMMQKLPKELGLLGVYNGVNGFDSFEDVLKLGKTPEALSSRFKDRYGGFRGFNI